MREQSDGRYPLGMTHPGMDTLFWGIALWRRFVSSKINVQILSDVEIGTTQIVSWIVNWSVSVCVCVHMKTPF